MGVILILGGGGVLFFGGVFSLITGVLLRVLRRWCVGFECIILLFVGLDDVAIIIFFHPRKFCFVLLCRGRYLLSLVTL